MPSGLSERTPDLQRHVQGTFLRVLASCCLPSTSSCQCCYTSCTWPEGALFSRLLLLLGLSCMRLLTLASLRNVDTKLEVQV